MSPSRNHTNVNTAWPADAARAQALVATLAMRAAADAQFRADLERWQEQAGLVRTGGGDVKSTISGGTFYGPTPQGRDFPELSITAMPPPAAGPATPSA